MSGRGTTKKTVRKQFSSVERATTMDPKPRRLHLPPYKLLRLRPRIKHPVRLPSVWILTKKTAILLWQNRRLFIGIAIIYGLLNIIFVTGLSGGTDVSNLKHQFNQALAGNTSQIVLSFSIFVALLASSGNNSSATAGAYQIFLAFIISLATIWALRQVTAGTRIRLRDPFYKGMYPLIPFILVLLVVLLQTVPFIIGGAIYGTVTGNGIAASLFERIIWAMVFLVLTLTSIYMLCSSLFALYIVTLPDMSPMKALKSARQLVRYRRPTVFRKLVFLPIALLVIAVAIMVPIIMFAAPLAEWIFFALTMAGLIVIHTYMYTLYRELLNENG